MLKTTYPYAFVIRDIDNLVHLEVGCIDTEDKETAFRDVLSYAQDMKLKDPKFKSVEIVKIGSPKPIQ